MSGKVDWRCYRKLQKLDAVKQVTWIYEHWAKDLGPKQAKELTTKVIDDFMDALRLNSKVDTKNYQTYMCLLLGLLEIVIDTNE